MTEQPDEVSLLSTSEQNQSQHFLFKNLLSNIHIGITIILSVCTFLLNQQVETAKINIDKTNQEIASIQNKFKRNQDFVDEIKPAINEFSEGKNIVKSKMTLVGLYALTENDQNRKYVLVNLASASEKLELIETINSLLEGEYPQGVTEQDLKNNPVLAAAKVRLARRIERNIELNSLLDQNNGDNLVDNVNEKGKDTKKTELLQAQTSLLSQLTPDGTVGWIYLGRESTDPKYTFSNAIPSDKARAILESPSKGGFLDQPQEMIIKQNINLRLERPSNSYKLDQLPRLIGTIKKDSKIRVKAIYRVASARGYVGIWAQVEVVKKV